ncbi:MAG: complex I NDUFA9 subunit family protein [Holosporales bacterium]
MHYKTAFVFGGTGFVGRQVVEALAKAGYRIGVPTRNSERVLPLKTSGFVGQITALPLELKEPNLVQMLSKADVVVNLIGILTENRQNTFTRVHVDISNLLARAAARAGVERFIQVSSLAADKNSTSVYARTKAEAEDAVRRAFPEAIVIRPSLIFGHGDGFFQKFAQMARFIPILPLIGGGRTKFQPVYVGDVAKAVLYAAQRSDTQGMTYYLGGNEVLTFKECLQYIIKITQQHVFFLPLPWGVAGALAWLQKFLPKPFFTRDQLRLLTTDNIVPQDAPGLKALDITATDLDAVLPQYLEACRPGGRWSAGSVS